MNSEITFFQRATAAFGAVALTMSLLVSYFATPEVQAVSSVLV